MSRTHRAGLAACALLTRAVFLVVAKVQVDGAEVRPVAGRGAIIAINHRSMLDFFVGTVAFRQWAVHPHTLARGDFFTRPVLGPALRSVGGIPAGGGHGAAATFALVGEVLHGGGVIAIAPEGRVVAPEQRPAGLGAVRGGVGVMSSQFGTPILLAAITNTDLAWPLGRRAPRLHLPWNRPTITVSVTWLEVQPGTPPAAVTARVADGLRELLGRTPQQLGLRDDREAPESIVPEAVVAPST